MGHERFTDEEHWHRQHIKYTTDNPISRLLVTGFFSSLEKLAGTVGPQQDLSVLEVGCGIGQSSMRLHRMFGEPEMQVSDFNPYIVKKLQEQSFPFPIRQESATNLQREDKSFDVVVLLEVLEHIPDYEEVLSELFRVSRRHVIVSVPNEPVWRMLNMARGKYWSEWGNTPTHVNHWSRWGIQSLVGQYGTVKQVCNPIPWTMLLAEVDRPSR